MDNLLVTLAAGVNDSLFRFATKASAENRELWKIMTNLFLTDMRMICATILAAKGCSVFLKDFLLYVSLRFQKMSALPGFKARFLLGTNFFVEETR